METYNPTTSLPKENKESLSLEIKEGKIDEVVALSQEIPEFNVPHKEEVYRNRLHEKNHLILVAYINGAPIGFKVGYEKEHDGSFYSWMGGIKPKFRNYGVAKALAKHQEIWARNQGYEKLRFKTRNNLKAMQIFALKNGFDIVSVEPRETVEAYRIILEKAL